MNKTVKQILVALAILGAFAAFGGLIALGFHLMGFWFVLMWIVFFLIYTAWKVAGDLL